MTLQQFLSKRDLSLTLTNEQGEAVYLGEALTVKAQKDRHYLKFSGTLNEAVFPYTKAVLHSGRNIFSIITIKPTRVNGSSAIELEA